MLTNGEDAIKRVVTGNWDGKVLAPCGACRELMTQLIQEVISPLVKGKIVLEIAHRMRTVKNADQIIVLDGGVVADYDQVVWSFIVKEKCIERLAGNIKFGIIKSKNI